MSSDIGALHQLTGFFQEANVDLLSMHIRATRGKAADVVAYVEMGESNLSIEKMLKAMRELDYVEGAEAGRKDKVIFEESLFPMMIDDDVRGFLVTDGAWMSIARRLVLTYGTGGLAILHEAGKACGEEYAKHLQSRLGLKASQEALVANLIAMLRAAGMGIAQMDKTQDGFVVKVREPIIPATETKIHDHFLTGVIAGASGHLFATSYSVEKVRFEGSELEFVLAGRRAEALTREQRVKRSESNR